jgi:hypothetical protein
MAATVKSFGKPDQVLDMERGKIEVLALADGAVGRATFQPGWKWSEHEKPVVDGGDWCAVPHVAVQLSGRLRLRMSDGAEFESNAGDLVVLPAGHDGWVVGDEAVVLVDFGGVAKDGIA